MKRVPLLCVLVASACSREAAQPPASDQVAATDSVHAAVAPSDSVQPGAIPQNVSVVCDTAVELAQRALDVAAARADGSFHDQFQGMPRSGCRLTGRGVLAASRNAFDPVIELYEAFAARGWAQDLMLSADGPDGSAFGMRRKDMLCLLAIRYAGDHDDSVVDTPQDSDYDVVIECARDVRSNQHAAVPADIWSIAAELGFDSLYAISLRLQVPPYVEGDFDGDNVRDAAVLIEERASGKLGMAMLHRGTRRAFVVGAGTTVDGAPDDLSWMDRMVVFPRGTTAHLTIGDRPSAALVGDALWVARQDVDAPQSRPSAFIVWNGTDYGWEQRRR